MIFNAKIKKVGEPQYKKAKVNLPDECKHLNIEQYEIEMIEFPDMDFMCIHFVKDGEDVYSETVKRYKLPELLKEGFKNAINAIKDDDEHQNGKTT
jgi:hypothetical protein